MLKTILLRRRIDQREKDLAALREQDAGYQTREAELEAAVNEVDPANEEERSAIEAEIETFESAAPIPRRSPPWKARSRSCARSSRPRSGTLRPTCSSAPTLRKTKGVRAICPTSTSAACP